MECTLLSRLCTTLSLSILLCRFVHLSSPSLDYISVLSCERERAKGYTCALWTWARKKNSCFKMKPRERQRERGEKGTRGDSLLRVHRQWRRPPHSSHLHSSGATWGPMECPALGTSAATSPLSTLSPKLVEDILSRDTQRIRITRRKIRLTAKMNLKKTHIFFNISIELKLSTQIWFAIKFGFLAEEVQASA